MNCVVEDGGHLFSGDVYAEMEVMKMVMELRVTEDGWLVICFFVIDFIILIHVQRAVCSVLFYTYQNCSLWIIPWPYNTHPVSHAQNERKWVKTGVGFFHALCYLCCEACIYRYKKWQSITAAVKVLKVHVVNRMDYRLLFCLSSCCAGSLWIIYGSM